MNYRWKIALLTLLGFSTAACCSTKKASKGDDKANNAIETEGIDNRVMLMYGVPMPDGRPVILEDEKTTEAKEFPDGSVAKPLTDAEAERLKEAIRAEKEQADSLDLQISVMYGVPFPDGEVAKEIVDPATEAKEFPDGSVAKPLTDEQAQATLEKIRQEKAEAEK